METVEKIKELTEQLSVDAGKFYNGNKSAGIKYFCNFSIMFFI